MKKVQSLKTYCTMTLFAFFSSYNQFVALNIEIKTPATAVLLLNSSEDDIVVKACNGIRTFAEKGTACSKKTKKWESFHLTHFIWLMFWFNIEYQHDQFSVAHHGRCFISLLCPHCKPIATKSFCWVSGFWVLCVSSSLTATSWSDVKLWWPWGPWPPTVSQATRH